MKKKLLFIILLLIPFIVFAAPTADNIYMKWRFDKDSFIYNYYEMNDTFIAFNSTELLSVEKTTGKEKTVSYAGSHYQVSDDEILVIDQVEDHINIIIYDEYLNEKSTKTIENIHLRYFNYMFSYDVPTETLILVGDYLVNGDYHTYVYFLNYAGEIIGNCSFNTIQRVNLEMNNIWDYFYILRDFNNNVYYIDEYEHTIMPKNMNDDDTYMYLENTKLYKMNLTGGIVDELDIPDGKGSKILKDNYGDYIVDTEEHFREGNNYSVNIKLFRIDEDLNILDTNIFEEMSYNLKSVPEDGFDQYDQVLYPGFETDYIFLRMFTENGYNTCTIDYDLNCYAGGYPFETIPVENDYSLNSEFPFHTGNNGSLAPEEIRQIDKMLAEQYGYQNTNISYFFDNENIVLVVTQRDYRDINDDLFEVYLKESLVYLDSDYNLIFEKDIYDWEKIEDYYTSTDESRYYGRMRSNKSTMFGDSIIVAITSPEDIIIQVYDREGNLVKDYSEYAENYKLEPISGVRTTPNGFYVAIGLVRERVSHVKSSPVDSFYVFDEYNYSDDELNSGLLYFTNDFNIKTKVTGKGTITTNLNQAIPGEKVTFTLTPDEGYVLNSVKVTDEFGNAIELTDYSFTMTSADVLIEAEFVLDEISPIINPNTSDIATIAFFLIAIASVLFFIRQSKKLNFLK